MSTDSSVTHWIAALGSAEANEAQQRLWERYFCRLLGLAKLKLGETPTAVADAEDVATAALQSLFAGARDRRFPRLEDRHDLWPLLAKITAHKALDQQRWLLAEKRGGGNVRGDSALISPSGSQSDWPAALVENEIGPDVLVSMAEQCNRLMALLSDDQMRQIARRRLEGYTNAEIAQELGIVERTVERRLQLIRSIWSQTLHQDAEPRGKEPS